MSSKSVILALKLHRLMLERAAMPAWIFYAGLSFAVLCLLWGFLVEVRLLIPARYRLHWPGLPADARLKVLFFSDSHLGPGMPPARLDRFCRKMAAEQADLILFGGDLLDRAQLLHDPQRRLRYQKIFSQLKAPLGAFAVLGNHDTEAALGPAYAKEILEAAGFRILSNEAVDLPHCLLMGLAEARRQDPDYATAIQGHDETKPQLLLMHQGDVGDRLPQAAHRLQLSGHSHNGQISFFGWRPKREHLGKKYMHGLYTLEGGRGRILVSSGLGTCHIHARFCNPPEYLSIELHGQHEEIKQRFPFPLSGN